MSVLLDAYAVDRESLAEQLVRPLREVVEQYVEEAEPSTDARHHWRLPVRGLSVHVVPRDGLVGSTSELDITGTVGEAVGVSVYALVSYLQAMSRLPVPWLHPVIAGRRRWWLGAALDAAAASHAIHGSLLEQVVESFARMLRGYDSGSPLLPERPRADSAPLPGTFPVIPPDDPDLRMGVVPATEVTHLHEFMTILRAQPLPAVWSDDVRIAESTGPDPILDGFVAPWTEDLARRDVVSFIG